MTEAWNGNQRRDGLLIGPGPDGHWNVWPPPLSRGWTILSRCPCCGFPMESRRAAQLVADKFYPMAPE